MTRVEDSSAPLMYQDPSDPDHTKGTHPSLSLRALVHADKGFNLGQVALFMLKIN